MSLADDRSPAPRAAPVWRIVFWRELRDHWVGGKALVMILIYTLLLGIYAYLFASNSELQLLPLKEVVLEIVKAAVFVGLFICLIVGADSVSGERERATLEGLLLTPTSRRQIIVGKFLSALSLWPATLMIAIPYWVVLSKGDPVLRPAVLWGPVMGTLLAPAFAGIGMLASIWSNSNKASMLVSIGLYLLMILPSEYSGLATTTVGAQSTGLSDLFQLVNPLGASSRLLHESIMADAPSSQLWLWMTSPILLPAIVLAVLFVYAGPSLQLEVGMRRLRVRPT
ncbi:MAG TPA: ABC transporter permease subunit [Gemmatimonadales bacterium]|nr:ABC transporter permease subunit [Gemmatimonadales bacterium]